jgi:hypothetical protein
MAGFDGALLEQINVTQAINRVACDVHNDFIVAPHYSAVFKYASDDLWQLLKTLLNNGKYNPQLPINIEVPKKTGLTRPGSILNPIDRLLYQCIADRIAPEIERQIDRDRVFSQVLNRENDDTDKMFESSGVSYKKLQIKLSDLCSRDEIKFALVADIACFFERIYQHVLINMLRSSKCENEFINLLEKVLSSF